MSASQQLLTNNLLQLYLINQIKQFGDGYKALFSVALDETGGDLKRAVRIADQLIARRTGVARARFAKADDCGHTPSGSFDLKNTCGGEKSSSPKENKKKEILEYIDKKIQIRSKAYVKAETEYEKAKEAFKKADNGKWGPRLQKLHQKKEEAQERMDKIGSSLARAQSRRKRMTGFFDSAMEAIAKQDQADTAAHSRFIKIPDTTKDMNRHEVAVILSEQYFNKNSTPEQMAKKWLTSSRYTLLKDVPLWVMRPFRYETRKSYSKGPLILDADKVGYKYKYGSFGSDPNFIICDGKHRWSQAIRDGKKTWDCYVGNAIKDDLERWVAEFGPKRERFANALEDYYDVPDFHTKEELIEAGLDADLTKEQLETLQENYKQNLYFDVDLGSYQPKEKSRFAADCGHTPSGSFSHGNTCASFRDSVMAAVKRVPKEKLVYGEAALIHHAHEEYAKTPEGKGVSLPEFKRMIGHEMVHGKGLPLSRHDLTGKGAPQSETEKAQTLHPGGGTEWHKIRVKEDHEQNQPPEPVKEQPKPSKKIDIKKRIKDDMKTINKHESKMIKKIDKLIQKGDKEAARKAQKELDEFSKNAIEHIESLKREHNER